MVISNCKAILYSFHSLRSVVVLAILLAFVFSPGIADADIDGIENAEIDSPAVEKTLSQSVWSELAGQRDRNTRQWEVAKWVETIDPRTQEVETTQVKSRVIEKGCGICYLDSNGQYQVSQIEWRDAGDAFVMDKANYQLVIGKTAGTYLNYFIDGECLQLRPRKLIAVSADKSEILSQINGSVEGCIDADNKNILTFKDAFGAGIDLQLEAYAGGYHQNVIFNNRLVLPEGFDADTTSVKLYTEMGLNEYMASGKSKNAVVRSGENDIADFSIDNSGISSGDASGKTSGHIRFVANDNGQTRLLHSFVDSDVFKMSEGTSRSAGEKIATATKEIVNDGTDTFLVETLDAKILTNATNPVVWDYHSVSGTIDENEIWYADATYYINGDLYIDIGVTLTIEPGTVIKVQSGTGFYYGIYCEGSIIAKGEPHAYITFTSSLDGSIGEDTGSGTPAVSDWFGLLLDGYDEIEFCRFRYSNRGIYKTQSQGDCVIQNNIISDADRGIDLNIGGGCTTSVTVSNNLITDVNIGIRVSYPGMYTANREVVLRSNTIVAQTTGISVNDSSGLQGQAVQIYNNLITGATTCIGVTSASISENNNAFYDYTTAVDGGHHASDKPLSISPFESSTTQLGSYYLNDTTGGGADIKDAGYDTVGNWYDNPNQWAIYHVPNDGDHILAGSVYMTEDVTLEPNYDVCDTGTVAIGYHHPRIDYLFNQTALENLGGSWSMDARMGTVIAVLNYACVNVDFEAVGSPGYPVLLVSAGRSGQQLLSGCWTFDLENDFTLDEVEISGYSLIDIYARSNPLRACRNCRFIGSRGPGLRSRTTQALENCLFLNCDQGVTWYMSSSYLTLVNCEFIRCEVGAYSPAEARNCLFRHCDIGINGTYTSESYNAFYENATADINGSTIAATDYSDQASGSQLLAAADFYNGWTDWEDRFYLPSASKLVDAGDAADTPMWGYTTDLDCMDDSNTRDIGYHYTIAKWYVDGSAATSGSGLSWGDCFKELSEALANPDIAAGDQIWVAAGTYLPDTTGLVDPRLAAFYLPDGVKLYGGFDGTETIFDDRDYRLNETFLSGNIGVVDTQTDNCYRVVYSGIGSELDGCIICDGYSLDIQGVFGAGLYITSEMEVRNCTFSNSRANLLGGGICIYDAAADISNCLVYGNYASYGAGVGAYYSTGHEQDALTIKSLTVAQNLGLIEDIVGSGIFVQNNIVANITNTIACNNYYYVDEVFYCDDIACTTGSTVHLAYSDVFQATGVTDDGGNISAVPQFADPLNYDFSLKSVTGRYDFTLATPAWVTDTTTSPCLAAGDPYSDYSKEPTPNGFVINMGFDGNTAYASKVQFGTVEANITPAAIASHADAWWTILYQHGDAWSYYDGVQYVSSDVVTLPTGSYGIYFNNADGYGVANGAIPTVYGSIVPITVTSGGAVTENVTYVQGSLTVDVSGAAGQWRLTNASNLFDSGYKSDGATVTGIPVGDGYVLSFTTVSGYYTPTSISSAIVPGSNGPVSVTYRPQSSVSAYYVSTSGSNGNDGSSSYPFRNIWYAISVASDKDVIVVRDGTYNEGNLSFGGKDIQLIAENAGEATISANGAGRVFSFNGEPSTALLQGFEITGGDASGTGGGIRVYKSAIKIQYCSIHDCEALNGGGIGIEYSPGCRVEGCWIYYNEAKASGSQYDYVANGGGLSIINGGTVTGCYIFYNDAGDRESYEVYHENGACSLYNNGVFGGMTISGGCIYGSGVKSYTNGLYQQATGSGNYNYAP